MSLKKMFKKSNYFFILPVVLALLLIGGFVWSATDAVNVSLSVTATTATTCTDPLANNYGGALPCTYGGGGGGLTCDDPKATNYGAEEACVYSTKCEDRQAFNYGEDLPCLYRETVPNVSNFQAEFNINQQKIYLTWSNPNFEGFEAVRIVRSTFGIPANPEDGAVVYEGSAENVVDPAVEFRVRYYYTAFVKNQAGEYSSGAVASAIGLKEGDICPDGNCGSDPFAFLPGAKSTVTISDFILRQIGELTKYFSAGAKVKIQGTKNLMIEIDKNSLPTVLKTIGVVISDPKNVTRSFSFIMRDDGEGRYLANLSPFWRNGVFPVTIYVINYQDQTVKKITGSLQVAGVSFLRTSGLIDALEKYIDPLVTMMGLGAGLSQIILMTTNVHSVYDLYLFLMRLIYSFLSWLGIRRKPPEWGTVFDAVTKQPIDPAYVTVENVAGREVASAITDIDGRFGFLLPKDIYQLKVGKTNYIFPSEKLKNQDHDELYPNLYFGTPLVHDGNQIIKLNIPLDPLGFDWNEFAKSKMNFFRFYTKREAFRRRVLAGIFYTGFTLSLFKALMAPSVLDFVLLAVYFGLWSYQRIWQVQHKIISIRRANGESLAFSLVRLYLPGIDQPIKSASTDQLGRLYVLVRPGTYYLTVEEKMPDGSYHKIHQSAPFAMPKGVLDHDIII